MAKKTEKTDNSVPNPLVESGVEKMIQIVRGKQVLLDRDLATLYGVETKRINSSRSTHLEVRTTGQMNIQQKQKKKIKM